MARYPQGPSTVRFLTQRKVWSPTVMPFLDTSWLLPPVMLRDRVNLLSKQVIPGRPCFMLGLKLIKRRGFSCTGPASLMCARCVLAWALPTAKEPNLKLPEILYFALSWLPDSIFSLFPQYLPTPLTRTDLPLCCSDGSYSQEHKK